MNFGGDGRPTPISMAGATTGLTQNLETYIMQKSIIKGKSKIPFQTFKTCTCINDDSELIFQQEILKSPNEFW